MEKIVLEPIGVVFSPYKAMGDAPRQGKTENKNILTLKIYDKYLAGISDIKKDDFIYILFHFSKSTRVDLRLVPPNENKIKGVFSTRSPNRPNHIGITKVKVLDIAKNTITFVGGDMLDNTPVIDIKPELK